MPNASTLIVVPCYNEETRLPQEAFRIFMASSADFRFLFVDDGSSDKTFEALDSLKKNFKEKVQILRLEKNSGKAEAVRLGFLEGLKSKPNFMAYWDADLATPLDVLPRFLELFHERPDLEMIFGARVKLLGHDIQRRLSRHYLGRVFATCASFVLGLPIYDTQCGAKMFRVTKNLETLFQQPFHSKWIFDVELIARYLKSKKSSRDFDPENCICELPLPVWKDVRGSKVKPGDFFKAFGELVAIYRRYR